jgi:hypothetical protein
MNRKNFIKKCSFACISGAAFAAVMQSCTTTKMTNGNISGDDLIVPISDFETKAGNEKHFKKYVVIQNDILKYPICVYRHTATEYSALWMHNVQLTAANLITKAKFKMDQQIINLKHSL